VYDRPPMLEESARIMIARALVLCGVALSHVAAQKSESAPASRRDSAALCAKLRADEWSPESFQALIAQLASEKAWFAVEWWLKAADDAVAAGKLPASARSSVASVRSKVVSEHRAGAEARAIWTAVEKHVRDLIKRKAPREAERAVFTAEALAAVWNEADWTRISADLWKLIKATKDASGEAGVVAADRKLTADLEMRLAKDLAARATRASDEFSRYGCARGYVKTEALQKAVSRRAIFSPGLTSVRAAARGFGLGRDLVAHVLGATRIIVRQDGGVVPLEGAAGDGSVDAREFRDIRLKVLPGEIVGFELVLPPDAPTQLVAREKEFPYAELYVHARYRDKDLPKHHWQAASSDQFAAPDPSVGGTYYAAIGENRGISIDGEYPICMNYARPGQKPSDGTIVLDARDDAEQMGNKLMDSLLGDLLDPRMIRYDDRQKAIEAKVPDPKTGFEWTVAFRPKLAYVLLIPKDEPSSK
jgi:hypothetical protein